MNHLPKYRAWHKNNQVMWYPKILKFTVNGVFPCIEDKDLDSDDDTIVYEQVNNVLMEWTGKKDSSGQDAYAGDIIRPVYGGVGVIKFGEHYTSDDYYASPAYGWYSEKIKTKETTSLAQTDEFEIFGNVHQNPKLLEQG